MEESVGRSPVRTVRNIALGVAAVVVPALGIGTYVGMRQLTDAPRVRRPKRDVKARFHGDDDVEDADLPDVHVIGERASLPGTWGLRFDGGYTQVHHPEDQVHDEELDAVAIVRPYELLDGVAPTAEHQQDRRVGDRRARAEAEAERRRAERRALDDQPPEAGAPADPAEPAGQAEADAEARRRADRRQGDRRRRRRDRRQVQLPRPWPVEAAVLSYAWPDDPQPLARAAGATWSIEPVLAPGGGHLPAWRFDPLVSDDAARKTWVIGVHGRGARRAELFRIVHTALDCGNTALVISYRTDEWAAAPAPRLQLGQSEWEDLEHAVALALVRGAERIVLAGCSLGGSIVATFLRRSDLADRVVGVILDSPALDWGPILEHIASAARLPRWLVPPIMAAAKARSRLDFDALNHVKGADEFGHPILLFHGDADPIVPVWLSDAFAAARPDLVTYVRVDGAGHVHSWNHAPGRYRRALRDFFQQVNISHVPAAAPPSMVRRVARLLPDPPGRDNEAWR